jgi:endogenous inhibitor of DNA gyrase (YacG/DUF329 family)
MADKQKIIIGNCRSCEREIERGESVYWYRGSVWVEPNIAAFAGYRIRQIFTCSDCFTPALNRSSFAQTDCGGCGARVIANRASIESNYSRHQRFYCSTTCRDLSYIERVARPKQQSDCEHCGETYTQSRSDSRFCSTRCRVANHRSVA